MQILRQLPNLLTLLRLGMTVPIAWLLLEQQHAQALIWFALAGASDGLDGFLARRFGWVSRFGSAGDETMTGLAITEDGLLVASGTTTGQMGEQAAAGGADAFVIAFPLSSTGGGAASSV